MSARVSTGRGTSVQTYATPRDFIGAVSRLIGSPFHWDLAAQADNAVCPDFIDEARNSFTVDWSELGGWLWLNPPFSDIAPWAKKCAAESARGARIAFLVPASVGSVWYAEHVHGKARVLFIRPRLSFDGKAPYPKDCLLALYDRSVTYTPGCECWDWRAALEGEGRR